MAAPAPPPPDLERDKEPQARAVLRDDTTFAAGRITLFQYVSLGVFLYLISGFWSIQILGSDYYSEMADRNRIRTSPILAPRGKILDRDGRIIVDNHSSFSLILAREKLLPEHLKPICEGLDIDYEELLGRLRRFDRVNPKHIPITIKEDLNAAQIAFVEAHRDEDTFPEMEIIQDHRRVYPREGLLAHVIGYTGEVSDSELNTAEFVRYKPGDIIGKAGVERFHNELLMGQDGQRRAIVNNRGKELTLIAQKEAVGGQNIRLAIDLDVQVKAELIMRERRGAVVALDPRSGEVLALVSSPTYDPNTFVGRIRRDDWNLIRDNPEQPMLNRATQVHLSPGSTFKPIMAMAGLETGVVDENSTAHCSGGAEFYDHYFRCHTSRGHGAISLHRAMMQSCDVYFYNLGNRLGIDRLAYYSQLAGLGEKTGIDLPSEYEGLLPTRRWKIRAFRQRWFAGDTINVAIGQGYLQVTPLQLAHAVGGLAMGGVWYPPRLLLEPASPVEPRRHPLKPVTVSRVVSAMYGVMNEAGGTAAKHRLGGVPICGKTGTAQVTSAEKAQARKDARARGSLAAEFVDNAWFVGFAPCDKPEIVAAALYEAGEHGDRAAPLVRDVIRAYFAKKARRAAAPALTTTAR